MDPLPPSPEVLEALQSLGPPSHILLSCVWHTRAAQSLRNRWGCKVLLNEHGVAESEIDVDESFWPPCRLWEAIDLFPLTGLSWPEEVAVCFDQHLLIMDALVGGRADLRIPEGQVGIHPNRFTMGHIPDRARARQLILHLADLPLKEVHFGHGASVRLEPSAPLKKVASDQFCQGDAVIY